MILSLLVSPASATPWSSPTDGYTVDLPADGCTELSKIYGRPVRGRTCTVESGKRTLTVYVEPAPHGDEPGAGLVKASAEGVIIGAGGWEPPTRQLLVDGRLAFEATDVLDEKAPGSSITARVIASCGVLYTLSATAAPGLSNDVPVVKRFLDSFDLSAGVPCSFPWQHVEVPEDGFAIEAPGPVSLSHLLSIRVREAAAPGTWSVYVLDADDASWATAGGSAERAASWAFKTQLHGAPVLEQTAFEQAGTSEVRGTFGTNTFGDRTEILTLVQGRRIYTVMATRPKDSAISDADLDRFVDSFTLLTP